MAKRYDEHLIIIFKEAELSHKQVIDAFEGKKELYLNHNSNNTLLANVYGCNLQDT